MNKCFTQGGNCKWCPDSQGCGERTFRALLNLKELQEVSGSEPALPAEAWCCLTHFSQLDLESVEKIILHRPFHCRCLLKGIACNVYVHTT